MEVFSWGWRLILEFIPIVEEMQIGSIKSNLCWAFSIGKAFGTTHKVTKIGFGSILMGLETEFKIHPNRWRDASWFNKVESWLTIGYFKASGSTRGVKDRL